MEEKEIMVDGKKIKVAVKLPKEYIEDDNLEILLDDTTNLTEIITEVRSDE